MTTTALRPLHFTRYTFFSTDEYEVANCLSKTMKPMQQIFESRIPGIVMETFSTL